jgi:hypothetical protein
MSEANSAAASATTAPVAAPASAAPTVLSALKQAESLVQAEEASASAATAPTPAAQLDAFVNSLRNTAVSRDTRAWNRVASLVTQLKQAVAAVKE